MEGGNIIQFYGEGAEPQAWPYGEGRDDEHPGLPGGATPHFLSLLGAGSVTPRHGPTSAETLFLSSC